MQLLVLCSMEFGLHIQYIFIFSGDKFLKMKQVSKPQYLLIL